MIGLAFSRIMLCDTEASSKALLLQNDKLLEAGVDFNWRGLASAPFTRTSARHFIRIRVTTCRKAIP